MIEELLKSHSGDITKLISSQTGLDNTQSSEASSTVLSTIGNYVKGGGFDLSQIGDLFNSSTSNTANPLFNDLSGKVTSALTEKGLPVDVVSKISGSGLDGIISKLSSGGLQNFDFTSILSSLGGSDELMNKAKDLLGGFFK